MVQVRSLGPSLGGDIVAVEVVFSSGTKIISLSETKVQQLLQIYPNKYVEFKSDVEEVVKVYFDYHKYTNGEFAFTVGEQPIPLNWWVGLVIE